MSYVDEYQNALRDIVGGNTNVQNLSYFVDTATLWHARFEQDLAADATRHGVPAPRVAILGQGIPEQLVHACGTTPLHLLGGSHASCQWSDDVMPRDSDSASRSILGYALRLADHSDTDPLFVVPIANDNMRKIAYLLNQYGQKVACVDIPSAQMGTLSQRAWERSAIELVQAVQSHVGKRVTAQSIRQADQIVGLARSALLEFERTCVECYGVLSDETRLFVMNTYYQTTCLAQWTSMLRKLTNEVRARYRSMGRPSSRAPRVLVFGSPILFPQYKVPAIMRDAGLRLQAVVDATSTSRFSSLNARERRGGAERLVRSIARKHYALDSSSAHVTNQVMEQYLEYLLSTTDIDGVVCHILKGQIEHDFMLARMEPLFERYDVPVFRLETDYQYQDVEQLRIRLEAFAEMLDQRAYVAKSVRVRRSA